jgi:hypothetical protein
MMACRLGVYWLVRLSKDAAVFQSAENNCFHEIVAE